MGLRHAKDAFNKYKRYIFAGLVLFALVYLILESLITSLAPLPVEFYFGVTFILILAVIDYLEALRPSREGIFPDQLESTETISRFLKEKKVNRAEILAVSGSFERSIIQELLKSDSTVRLLLFDPRKTNDRSEQDLIMGSYETTLRYAKQSGKSGNIEIAFYDTPASLRGINFGGSLVAIGWYTYSKELDAKGSEIVRVTGYSNPFIVREKTTREGGILKEFFNEEFEKMWNRKTPAAEVENWWEDRKV